MCGAPSESITTRFGVRCWAGGKHYLLSSLTVGMGEPGSPIWVCISESGSGCLVPGTLPPSSCWVRVLSLGLVALRLRQSSIGPVWPSGYGAGRGPALPVLHTPACLRRWPWTPGLEAGLSSWAFWDGLGFFGWDRLFFQAPVPCFRGVPLCGRHPQGYECWGEVSPEPGGSLGRSLPKESNLGSSSCCGLEFLF